MNHIQIDKGIPIPGSAKRKPFSLYADIPWSKLEIGDSFVWEARHVSNMKQAAKKAGVDIMIKKILIRSWRVWRIA